MHLLKTVRLTTHSPKYEMQSSTAVPLMQQLNMSLVSMQPSPDLSVMMAL